MGKLVVVLFLILMLTLVQAVSVNIQDNYRPGETLIASIEGNFISPLETSDIYFYSGRKIIPMIYDLGKIQDKYYLYALLPTTQREYTLLIKNAHFFDQGEQIKDLSYNFSVSGNLSDFSVTPGFVINDKDFKIYLKAISKSVDVTVNFLSSSQVVHLVPEKNTPVELSIEDLENTTLTEISLTSSNQEYAIPSLIYANGINISEIIVTEKFRFSPENLNYTFDAGKINKINVSLINIGDTEIKNISLILPKELESVMNITPRTMSSLGINEEREIELRFFSQDSDYFPGEVEAFSSNYSSKIFLDIYFVEEQIPPINNTNYTPPKNTCYDFGGYLCSSGEKCSGSIKLSSEGDCCIGNCVKKKDLTSTIFGIILIILVIGVVAFFFIKSKKPGKTPRQLLNEKIKSSEERFNPSQIKGSLSRS